MSILRRIREPAEQRDLSTLAQMLENAGVSRGGPTYAGPVVTPDSAMRNVAVWACVRLLADLVSSMPVDVFRGSGPGRVEVPVPAVLVEPMSGVARCDWLYQAMVSLLLRGNAYGLIVGRDSGGRPAQVLLLAPDDVTCHQPSRYGPVSWKVRDREVPASDMWHVRAYSTPGSPQGLSPIAYARQSIGLGLAAEEFGSRFFGDGAHPTAVLESDQAVTQEQAAELKRRLMDAIHGRREVAVLGAGATWKPIQIAPDESQFLETQRWTVNQVARLFGVPAEFVGAAPDTKGSVTYANREQRAQDLLTFTLLPWLVRLETALSPWTPAGQQVRFNAAGVLRADLTARYEAHAIGIEHGFLTRNEARALEDLPALPGGDTLLVEVPDGSSGGTPVDPGESASADGRRNGHGDTDRLRVRIQH